MGFGQTVTEFFSAEGRFRAAVALGLIGVILLVAGFFLFSQGDSSGELSIKVQNQAGEALWRAKIDVISSGKDLNGITNRDGKAYFRGVERGKQLVVRVSGTGFKTQTKNITLEREKNELQVALEAEEDNLGKIKTVSFVGPTGIRLDGKLLGIQLSCSSGIAIANASRQVTSGFTEVAVPDGCGSLSARVVGTGFDPDSFEVDNTNIIRLSELEVKNGTVKVLVQSESGQGLSGVEIFVNDSDGAFVDRKISDNGTASFLLAHGAYKFVAVGASLLLESKSTEFSVKDGENSVLFSLKKQSLGDMKVKVTDKESNMDLNATVTIEGPDKAKSFVQGTGELSLPVTSAGRQAITAQANGYAPQRIEVDSEKLPKDATVIALQRCAQNNCNTLNVNVVDEDGNPVFNARVALLTPSGFVDDEYPLKYTGVLGQATFKVKPGIHSVLAQKYPASSKSEAFEVKQAEQKEISVKIEIGSGTVEVSAQDLAGNGIPFANASFFTGDGNKIGRLALDAQGRGTLTLKADRKVFVVFSATGFSGYTSPMVQLDANKIIKLVANLGMESPSQIPQIRLVQIADSSGAKADVLKAGNYYTAKFSIQVPQAEYERMGAFVSVGSETLVENDAVFIDKVNAPLSAVSKGTEFTPPHGMANDYASLTNEHAKWAEIIWDKSTGISGNVGFEVVFKVRESSLPGKKIPIQYRSFVIDEAGKFTRDPDDPGIGNSENSSAKDGLYARTYTSELSEGNAADCTSNVCLSESTLDLAEGILLEKPYSLKMFGNYDVSFSLANNSDADFGGSKLRIINSADKANLDGKLKMTALEFTDADGRKTDLNRETFEYKDIDLGGFSRGKSAGGKISIYPREGANTSLYLQVISESRVVSENKIDFAILPAKDLNVSIVPQTAPAFSEFDLEVLAKSSGVEFEELKGALVRVEITRPDRSKATLFGTTGDDGKARVKIPELAPNSRISISVEKAGYASKATVLKVTTDVISFKPMAVKAALDLTNNLEARGSFTATNLVPMEFTLSKAVFGGKFLGLLDEKRMNNYLVQFVGRSSIGFNDSAEVSILSALSEDSKFLTEPKKLNGRIYLEFENRQRKLSVPFELPYEAQIGLSEPPKQANCIDVSLKDWKDATISGLAVAEFSVRNNCLNANNRPLELKDIKAKINWKGNKIGFAELALLDTQTGQEAKQVLADNVYSTLVENVAGGKEYVAKLYFTPKGGTSGKKAQFSVTIAGSQFTNSGQQDVSAGNDIEAEIDVIDLKGCLGITPDPEAGVTISREATEGTIGFDSSACGNITIDLWLCHDNKDCANGSEGGILVQPDKFTLTPATSKKTVVVTRQEIPGVYGINVDVRTPATNYRRINNVDVLVVPGSDDPFELRKYEFSTIGVGSKDSTELTNRFLSETVNVDASVCDWGDATEKGWWNWSGAGVGAIMGALQGITPAMKAANLAAKGAAQSTGAALKGAKSAGSSLKATSAGSSTSLQALCNKIDSSLSSVQNAASMCSKAPDSAAILGAATTLITAAQTECENMLIDAQLDEQSSTDALKMYDLPDTGTMVASGKFDLNNGILALFDYPDLPKEPTQNQNTAYFSSGDSAKYVVPISIGVAGAAVIIPKLIASYAKKQSGIGLITAKLDAASAKMVAAQSLAAKQAWTQDCQAALSGATGQVQAASSGAKSYGSGDAAKGAAQAGALQGANSATGAAASNAGTAMTPAASAGSSLFTPANIMGAYTLGGFFIGGIYDGIFGADPCKQRQSMNLPDYVINLLDDAHGINSEDGNFDAQYNRESARIIGQFNKQKIGVVFTNNGARSQKPVYGTFTFNTTEHYHSNPTRIEKGFKDFGPFKIPDRQTLNVQAKLHLKFKTEAEEETLPELKFDTVSCVAGSKLGRTGKSALPKVKFDWSFSGIDKDLCVEGKEGAVYCDATQFSVMLSKRLNALREFFEKNQGLKCPENPLSGDFSALVRDLNMQDAKYDSSCYINDWSGYIENEPAIKILIEGNEKDIKWTGEIPDKSTLLGILHFNSLLIKDAYTQDFKNDFYEHYSDERFFDTPEWFSKLGGSDKYGIGSLFRNNRVSFTNKFFESDSLPGPGTYETLISLSSDDGSFRFFNADGTSNIRARVEFYLLSEPNPNSAFYYTPFDGLVGLNGDSLQREGYGVGFRNTDPSRLITFENNSQPLKSFEDTGSNSLATVYSDFDTSLYGLNSSPATRGNIFSLEKVSLAQTRLRFSPSTPTPVLLKLSSKSVSDDKASVFYSAVTNDVPVDAGSTLTYWDGAGACLGPQGVAITESFDNRSDRAALPTDRVNDWQSAYAVDFGQVAYTGDSYIRTIFFTNPLESYSLKLDSGTSATLMAPDESGQKISLAGVGASRASLTNVSQVFLLVEDGYVCVSDSGRKAEFFWNPKKVYGLPGKERNISEFTDSLVAGQTCTGFN